MKVISYFSTFFHDLFYNDWKPTKDQKYTDGQPMYLIDNGKINDRGEKDLYFNESRRLVRVKCLNLAVGTAVAYSGLTVYKIIELLSLSHFWKKIEYAPLATHNARKDAAIRDLKFIVKSPIYIVGLTLAAILGLISPYDARKLYASLEKEMNDGFALLAPCFQPYPTCHLFGGDPNARGAW